MPLILLAAMLGCYVASETRRQRDDALCGLLVYPRTSASLGGWLPKTHVRLPTIGASAKPLGTGSIQTRTAVELDQRGMGYRIALCFMRLLVGICRTARMILRGAVNDSGSRGSYGNRSAIRRTCGMGHRAETRLLPACASDWPVERRQLVLMHEHAHLTPA